MSPRGLCRLLIGYVLGLVVACASVHAVMHLDPHKAPTARRIVSVWKAGKRIAQAVVDGDPSKTLTDVCQGCFRIVDRVVDEGPLPSFHPWLIALTLGTARDGYSVELDGTRRYVTPSDLLARQANSGVENGTPRKLKLGLDDPHAELRWLAHELRATVEALQSRGHFRRVLMRREDDNPRWPSNLHANDVNEAVLRRAIDATAGYLARVQDHDGRFAYELEVTSGQVMPGYSWPRHGGATLFLAEAAAFTGNPVARDAALAAANLVARELTVRCGVHYCVGEGDSVDVGSSALALLAYAVLYEAAPSPQLHTKIEQLCAFLRSQQRPDGELMHVFDRAHGKAVDVQFQYYTGEAAYALSLASRVTQDPRDVQGASRALSHLIHEWSFFGSRYFFRTEHWTCQAMAELWDRAPDREALDFCLDYHAYNASFALGPTELGDYEGGFTQIPIFPPRITPTASRAEAAVAILVTALHAKVDPARTAQIEREVRAALAFMLRFALSPGPVHLYSDPLRPLGGIPGSPTELHVRIDYPQHAGGAMIRYARLLHERSAKTVTK